jgi:uncharacterized repeat protein (TIGR01451 family)
VAPTGSSTTTSSIREPIPDPGRIRFTIEGGDRIDLAANGDLLMHAGDDVVRFNKPTIYQQAGPDRDLVEGEYVRAGPAEFGFQIENYDTSRPLIIDPVLSPPTVFGGSDNESLNAVDVDSAGNIYVTGSTRSADFPTRNPLFPTETDVFIAKFDSTAQNMIWATFLGGSAFDSGQGLAVGAGGGVHVVGNTSSADFPLRDAMQQTHGGNQDGFVAKLNTDGDLLEWSTFLGGAGSDSARAVKIGSAGNILIGGTTSSADFPATAGALSETLGGEQDCFVSKLASSGQGLIFSTFLGGGGRESCSAIALTEDGEVAIVGASHSPDFPTTPGAFQPALNPKPSPRFPTIDFADAVAAVLNADGSKVVYGSYIGGADDDFVSAVDIDPEGRVWLGGGTSSTDFPVTPDADQPTPLFDSNAWIARLDPGSAAADLASYMKAGERLVSVTIPREKSVGNDYLLVSAVIKFRASYDRLTTLGLMSSAGIQLFATVLKNIGVTSTARWLGGVALAGITNGPDALSADAGVGTFTFDQEPTPSGPKLDVSKKVDPPGKVPAGSIITYTVKVFNKGTEDAIDVVLTDEPTLGLYSKLLSLPDKCMLAGEKITCDLGTVPAGGVGVSRVFKVETVRDVILGLTNTASVSASNHGPTQPVFVFTSVEEGTDMRIQFPAFGEIPG